MKQRANLDLVVLVADADAEWAVRTLLEQRTLSLKIRPVRFYIFRHPQRDPGVYLHAHEFLRQYRGKAGHALVLLDREGSGREGLPAMEMERQIEQRLAHSGWEQTQVAAIVLDPELEVWVWSSSPHVAEVIGLESPTLQHILNNVPKDPRDKPKRPKETLLEALRQSKRPFSARLFQELAAKVSLQSDERAFSKFRSTLQRWFPIQGDTYARPSFH